MLSTVAEAHGREHFLRDTRGNGQAWKPTLLLREQTPRTGDRSRPVLYVHGATFPSALSIMFKFDGQSWADSLNAAGFDVFGLDFAGYGGSERYPLMASDDAANAPAGRASEAADQIERAVQFIRRQTGARRVTIIAHSWGTIPAGLFAGRHPKLVDKLVLFGPVGRRDGQRRDVPSGASQLISVEDQHTRFLGGVPPGSQTVLEEKDFPRWAETYLDSDPQSRTRKPPAVRVPNGPSADVADAWSGHLAYDPALIEAPTLIIRGEWDSVSPTADMQWLKARLSRSAHVDDVVVPQATHLMHLETGRHALYSATESFLLQQSPRGQDRRMESLFAVVFEVRPDADHQADYLRIAGSLKPLLNLVPGFLENERFRSRTRPGILLSLSLWDDEHALVRWRTTGKHHDAQVEGRGGVLADYHLRVGEVTTAVGRFEKRRLGRAMGTSRITKVGAAPALTLVDSHSGVEIPRRSHCEIFDHLVDATRTATLCEWDTPEEADAFVREISSRSAAKTSAYAIRVIRDYGMADRREAPQYLK